MASRQWIASVDDVPAESTFLLTLRKQDSDQEAEAILVRSNGEVDAWLNYCQHFTHIRLDKGGGAEVRDGEVVCTNHGAYFESNTGYCTYGPCEGAYLVDVDVEVADEDIYLTDDDYEFVKPGPIDRNGLDLESKSNVEF